MSSSTINDFLSTPAPSPNRAARSGAQPADPAFQDVMATREPRQKPETAADNKTGQAEPSKSPENTDKQRENRSNGVDHREEEASEQASATAAETNTDKTNTDETNTDETNTDETNAAGLPVATQRHGVTGGQVGAGAVPVQVETGIPAADTVVKAVSDSTRPGATTAGEADSVLNLHAGTNLPRTGKTLPPAVSDQADGEGRDIPRAITTGPAPAAAGAAAHSSASPPPTAPATAEKSVALQGSTKMVQGLAQAPLNSPAVDTANEAEARESVVTVLAKPVQQPVVQQYQAAGERAVLMQTGVDTPVGDPKWRGAVHERVLWLASQNISAAEIHLDPPELGPLQVKITLSQDQVQVNFTSPHASVREALDIGSHRLRDLFEGQGLNLADVDVSGQSFAGQSDAQAEEHSAATSADTQEEGEAHATPINSSQGLVDHYV